MTEIDYDVCAIGNAIVDIIARCDDDFLTKHNATKGHMHLVDADQVAAIYGDMGPATEISGGSAANSMVGLASFGGRAAFIGKVANDQFGKVFRHDLTAANVHFNTTPVDGGLPTSQSLVLVTPDGERTMNTFLGISTELDDGEIAASLIQSSALIYLEGYLYDKPKAKAAFKQAAGLAKSAGRQVALTLSDSFCVDRHRDAFRALVKNDIDVLFANESEITSLYQTDSFNAAAKQASDEVKCAVLTRSEQGSVLYVAGTPTEVAAAPIEAVVDTTGAGDLYASGVLFGLAKGLGPETSGMLGSIAAAEVISHIGARPEVSLLELAEKNKLL
jgi:sugar/nucleoside kinase (ribokinase family)